MLDRDSAAIGRFDKSFLIHMIKDFFVILVIVTIVEFSIKAALVWFDYRTNGTAQATVVAEDLADNVREIMRNEGGPVAARTMYPILDRNWTDLGYSVAITPSAVTVRSIEAGFGFTPQGIPEPAWSEGAFKEARIDIRAEPFCLGCHSAAQVGETLGTVTVRNYLARDFEIWAKDIRLTASLAAGKILLHSLLLFLILRTRMEPLLQLRATVSNLARAYGRLDHRADIRTADEFGALARDLNLFLDRITRIVGELEDVLGQVVAANDDILSVQADLRAAIDRLAHGLRAVEREAMLSAKREPRLSNDWFRAIEGSVSDLDAALSRAGEHADAPAARALVDNLRDVVGYAEAQLRASEAVYGRLADLGDQSDTLRDRMTEMARLEERLKGIIHTCGGLVGRLSARG